MNILEQFRSERGINRRLFLKLSSATAGSALLASCGIQPPTDGPKPAPAPEPPGGSTTEIYGEQGYPLQEITDALVPGDYSELANQYELQSRRLIAIGIGERPIIAVSRRIVEGIRYIQRFSDAMKEHEEIDSVPLAELGMNGSYNIPIALPTDWRLSEVLRAFQHEVGSGKTQIIHDKMLDALPVYHNTDQKTPLFADATVKWTVRWNEELGWERQSTMVLGGLLTREDIFLETPQMAYKGTTAPDLAIVMLHEYMHELQLEKFLQLFLSKVIQEFDPSMTVETYNWRQDPVGLVHLSAQDVVSGSEKIGIAKIQEFRQLVHEKPIGFTVEQAEKILPLEAQANAVAYLFLHQLILLNNMHWFPGTRRADPIDDSLYREYFIPQVIGDTDLHALNPHWLWKHRSPE